MLQRSYPLDVSKEEADFGFDLTGEPAGNRVVARDLRAGLRAVKVRRDEGAIEYAICDDQLRPLRSRFPGRGST
jgi:hypothetical protein